MQQSQFTGRAKVSIEQPGSDLLPYIPGEYNPTASNQTGDHGRLPGGGGAGQQTRRKLTRKITCSQEER